MNEKKERVHLAGAGKARHRFDPRKVEKLYSPERIKRLRLRELLAEFALCPGQTVLDLGTGGGLLLPDLSGSVGHKGVVVGSDSSIEMIEYINHRFHDKIPDNVEICVNGEKNLPFASGTFHRVIMVCLLHELAYPRSILQET
ncbi:MAG: class I SAM-dependent methyltransferase, partial [bacterium]